MPPALLPVSAPTTEYLVWWVALVEEELELLLALVPVLVLEEGVMLRRFLAGVEEVEVRLRLLYKGVRLNQKKKRKQ